MTCASVSQEPFELAVPEFFDDFLRPMRWKIEPGADMHIDVKENDADYQVRVELPGVRKEDIDVSIDGDEVTLRATFDRARDEVDPQALLSERYQGTMTRMFTLGTEVDGRTAAAKYLDGILELTLPKSHGTRWQRVKVE